MADAARGAAGLRCLGKLGGIGAKADRGVGLCRRHVGRVRTGETIAQQHLHHAHAIDDRNRRLEAAVATALQRGLRRFERRFRREDLDGEGRLREHRRSKPERNKPQPLHFFLMKKVNSLFASACETSSWPVWRENVWKSFTAPGSVASTLSTSPDCMPVSAFFVRRIGSGQFSPRASSSLSKFMQVIMPHGRNGPGKEAAGSARSE